METAETLDPPFARLALTRYMSTMFTLAAPNAPWPTQWLASAAQIALDKCGEPSPDPGPDSA